MSRPRRTLGEQLQGILQSDARPEWWHSVGNLHSLAAWLNDEDRVDAANEWAPIAADEWLRFLEKPWKWQGEWEAYLAAGGVAQ